jgi:WD40 repeat protein
MFGLTLGALAFHIKPVHGLALNPSNDQNMVSCSEDGQIAVWNLHRFELINKFTVCNFLKGVYFYDVNRVRTWGSDNIIYECLVSNGSIVNTRQINGSLINTTVDCLIEITQERLIFCGGDEHYLDFFDTSYSEMKIQRKPSFG